MSILVILVEEIIGKKFSATKQFFIYNSLFRYPIIIVTIKMRQKSLPPKESNLETRIFEHI